MKLALHLSLILVAGLAIVACGSGAGTCRPPAPLPAGRTCGPVTVDATCTFENPDCGAWGICYLEAGHCSGGTNACCNIDYDCYDGECVNGVCASVQLRCGCDSDCTYGAVCIKGTCIKLPASQCAMVDDCSGTCSSGQCTCGSTTQQALCRAALDCCSGACVDNVCTASGEGGPCATNADCRNGACDAGVCRCLGPGSRSLGDPTNEGCCSGSVSVGVCQ
jgi:hypothetical protein